MGLYFSERSAESLMEVRNVSKLIGQFAMVGQLGLSLLMPLLMCLFACYLLVSKLSLVGMTISGGKVASGVGAVFLSKILV